MPRPWTTSGVVEPLFPHHDGALALRIRLDGRFDLGYSRPESGWPMPCETCAARWMAWMVEEESAGWDMLISYRHNLHPLEHPPAV
jgi:hypothetical protein